MGGALKRTEELRQPWGRPTDAGKESQAVTWGASCRRSPMSEGAFGIRSQVSNFLARAWDGKNYGSLSLARSFLILLPGHLISAGCSLTCWQFGEQTSKTPASWSLRPWAEILTDGVREVGVEAKWRGRRGRWRGRD